MEITLSSKVTQGYVAWFDEIKKKWKAYYAKLSASSIRLYSHQYSTDEVKCFTITRNTKTFETDQPGFPFIIKTNLQNVENDAEILFAPQNRADLMKWSRAITNSTLPRTDNIETNSFKSVKEIIQKHEKIVSIGPLDDNFSEEELEEQENEDEIFLLKKKNFSQRNSVGPNPRILDNNNNRRFSWNQPNLNTKDSIQQRSHDQIRVKSKLQASANKDSENKSGKDLISPRKSPLISRAQKTQSLNISSNRIKKVDPLASKDINDTNNISNQKEKIEDTNNKEQVIHDLITNDKDIIVDNNEESKNNEAIKVEIIKEIFSDINEIKEEAIKEPITKIHKESPIIVITVTEETTITDENNSKTFEEKVTPEVKGDINNDIKNDINNDIKNGIKEEIKVVIKEEDIKEKKIKFQNSEVEVKEIVNKEIKEEIKTEIKEVAQVEINKEAKKEDNHDESKPTTEVIELILERKEDDQKIETMDNSNGSEQLSQQDTNHVSDNIIIIDSKEDKKIEVEIIPVTRNNSHSKKKKTRSTDKEKIEKKSKHKKIKKSHKNSKKLNPLNLDTNSATNSNNNNSNSSNQEPYSPDSEKHIIHINDNNLQVQSELIQSEQSNNNNNSDNLHLKYEAPKKKLFVQNLTQFKSTVKRGVVTVENPLFSPAVVALKNQLNQQRMEAKANPGVPAVLELSNMELTSLPLMICKQEYISVLNLYMNQLKTLPPEIGGMNGLVQLGLNENLLTSIPKTIGKLTNLQILDLRYNRLQELNEEMCALPSLRRLFVRYNRITKLPENIGNLTSLEVISLRNNNLRDLPDSISQLSNLKVLDIHQNQISRLPSLLGLKELVDFDAQCNQLTRLPKDISTLRLKKLHIGHNKIKEFPTEICSIETLEEIDLDGNMLVSISEDIKNLKNLKQIYLSRNKLLSLPESFGCLQELRQLFLSGNRLERLPDSFVDLKELKEIDLGTNSFSEFPNPTLLKNVTILNIQDNTITSLPNNIDELVCINTLNLGENQIKSLPDSFCNISSLVNLRLNCNELEDLPRNFDELISLRTLQLDNNLFDELPPQVGFLANLVSLSLLDNDLHDLPDELINLHKLKQLKVDGNPLDALPPNISGGAAVFKFLRERVKERGLQG